MKIQSIIEQKLQEAFQPKHLKVENESHMHNVAPGSESHFKVVLACDAFEGKRQVQRHQLVYATLKDELAGEVHALALHTYSPSEWLATDAAPASPQCLGGEKQTKDP